MILAGALVGPGTAQAETPGAKCLAIKDTFERLACFDVAIGAAVQQDAQATSQSPVAPAPAAEAAAASPPVVASLIDTTWGFLPDSKPTYLRLHQPNYLLFGRYTTDANTDPYEPLFEAFDEEVEFEDVEAKFQLSLKGRLLATEDHRWGLWFAYTQQSQWQIFSPDISRPFRETNYMPELFGSFRPGIEVAGMQWNLLNFGYTHQSNGRSDPISRSWDRLFVEAGLERGNLVLLARAWHSHLRGCRRRRQSRHRRLLRPRRNHGYLQMAGQQLYADGSRQLEHRQGRSAVHVGLASVAGAAAGLPAGVHRVR